MGSVPAIVPVSDLRRDAARIIANTVDTREPVFVTQRGRPTAVMVSFEAYEESQHQLALLRILARGEAEIEAGEGYTVDEVLDDVDRILRGDTR